MAGLLTRPGPDHPVEGATITSDVAETLRGRPRWRWLEDRWLVATLVIATILSIAATWYAAANHLILLWNDAHAHLQIARRIFDNLSPGLAQFGGVWLPLPHLVMLPFIWIDPLWQSGLAGSIPSMVSYVVTSVTIYLFARRLTNDRLASFLGALVFMINPNVLYLQSTPLSELVLIATMTLACYSFLLWAQDGTVRQLIVTGGWTFLATLARYDGWALFMILLVGVWLIDWIQHREREQIEADLLVYGVLGGLGILLWFVWNQIIFGDILYFQHSQFSSQAQQLPNILEGLDAPYHNLFQAFRYYLIVAAENVGPLLLLLGFLGAAMLLARKTHWPTIIAASAMLIPFVFYIVALFTGQAILFSPDAGPTAVAVPYYNLRYGVQMAAPVAALLPLLISRFSQMPGDRTFPRWAPWLTSVTTVTQRIATYFLPDGVTLTHIAFLLLLTAQMTIMVNGGIITVQEGQFGVDCFHYSTVPVFLARHYNGGLILNDPFFNEQDLSMANIDFQRIVYEGTGKLWNQALKDPASVVAWIIMKPGDLVATNIDTKSPAFLATFTLVGSDPQSGVLIYHRNGGPPLPNRPIPPALQYNYYPLCGAGLP